MKKIIPYVMMVAAAFGSMSLQAQTADEIVSKHIEALGGKDVIKKVNSIYMEGSTQVMGNESPTTETILNGKGYKNESDFNGQKMVQCVNDKGGWTTNPMGGGGAQAMPEDAYKSSKGQLNVGGALYDYAAKGSTVELLGKDGAAYKLKLVTADKDETTYYIDGSTYYISKIVKKGNVMGQDVEITIAYTDYKKTEIGYVLPFTRNIDLGQFQLSTTFTKAEINKPVDPTIFNMPK